MTAVERLEKIYADYLRDMRLSDDANGGLQGMFKVVMFGPRGQDVCNLRFVEDTEAVFRELDPAGEELRAVTEYVFDKSVEYRDNISAGMMLSSVLRFLTPMLAGETPEYRAQLASRFDSEFPSRIRTPVMQEFRNALG